VAQEKPDHTTYRVSASLHDMRKTFLHVWSLAVVLMIATILGLLGPFQTQANAAEVAMSIFQVSGTMVALVLPAAELANSFITKFSDELLLKIMGQNVPAGKKADVLMEISEELRNNLTPGWRASIYALLRFYSPVL
jgi:hypothetical protein